MTVKAALFDWDGTLLDTRDVLLGTWHAATDAVLGERWPLDAAGEQQIFTRPGVELFPAVAADRADELATAWQAAYAARAHLAAAFDGIAKLLEAVRADGIPIGVVTSKVRLRFADDAARTGLAGHLDATVCAEDVARHKPHPDPVLKALELLDADAADAIFLGDTHADIGAAVAAGVRAVGCTWGMGTEDELRAAGADEIVHRPAELQHLIHPATTLGGRR